MYYSGKMDSTTSYGFLWCLFFQFVAKDLYVECNHD